MNRYYIILILFINTFLFSCVDRYYIDDQVEFTPLLVIDGTITDEEEYQEISVSQSTELNQQKFNPLSGCYVMVSDLNGNEFEFHYTSYNQNYYGNIPMQYLIPGNAFKVTVIYNGKTYESDFEEMTACPTVDSVYYETKIESFEDNSLKAQTGVQFYVDLRIADQYSKYYRWKVEETYEYHATWPIEEYWAGRWVNVGQDYSYYICYKTEPVKELFSVSTQYVDNVYLKYPLNFVDNTTQRLYFKYSLLTKQYSITKEAYDYWQLLMANSQESGGLFDKQPADIRGNVYCVDDEDEKVLGYFGVSSVNTKRIFVDKPAIDFTDDLFCTQVLLEMPTPIYSSTPDEWPYYVAPVPYGESGGIWVAPFECFDCRLSGGSIVKPDFWE